MTEIADGRLREWIAIKAHYDTEFRTSLLCEPKETLERLIQRELPETLRVHVIEDTDAILHVVIPSPCPEEFPADHA